MFFTFAQPSEKTLKIVIKDITYNVTDDEILEELKNLGFDPKFIRLFFKNGKKILARFISLANLENTKEIYELSENFYVKMNVDSYKSSAPAQCFLCQHFEHFSLQCGHPLRCVKCGKSYVARE